MNVPDEVEISIEGDEVVVIHPDLLKDRSAKIMFGSILGGISTSDGWRCHRRKTPIEQLVVRINGFLEERGWKTRRVGNADNAVLRAREQRQSFERTYERASQFRDGENTIDLESVHAGLRKFGWNYSTRELKPYQEQGLLHGLSSVNAANFSVPGSGKTATTLAVAATHLSQGNIDLIVVVGPLACFDPWEREVRTATPGRIDSIRVRGNRGQRHTLYESAKSAQLFLISYATAAADRLSLINLCQKFRVMLVVDESHRVKRFRGGVWAPALVEIASYARIRFILSGTPMPQGGRDLYTQLNILWPSGELTGPRDRFAADADQNMPAILETIMPFVSRTSKAALHLPPYQITNHDVPLSETQREIYELIEGNFRTRIAEAEKWQEKLETLRRGRPIRLLQAAANPDLLNKIDGYYRLPRMEETNPTLMDRLLHYPETQVPAKSLKALEIISEIIHADQKVVCWSNFVLNLDQFSELVRSNVEIPCFQIDGRVPVGDEAVDDDSKSNRSNSTDVDTREQIISRFLDIPGPAVLVTNPASCSESISLHRSCRNAIYLDRTYDCALFLQSIDRIHRLGLPDNAEVKIHILIATIDGRPTIDGFVHQSLLRKETDMKRLLEGAELNALGLDEDPLTIAGGDQQDLEDLLKYLLGEDGPEDAASSI